MESKIVLIVVNIAILTCFIQYSSALRCYQCATKTNSNCTYLISFHLDKTIRPEECVFAGNSVGNLTGKSVVSPTCLKIESTYYYGRVVTHDVVRRCVMRFDDLDPCTDAMKQYTDTRAAHQSCGFCSNKDGCNSANSLKLFSALVVFGTMLSSNFLFI